MKKAFTLIELLAVIIILAVIVLIATPVMTNVIENAREEARKDSVIGYADSVRLSYAEESLINTGKPLKELASEKMQGDEVVCEYVKYDTKEYGTLLHSCKVEEKGNYCYFSGVVYNNESEECNNILSLIMNENIPYNTPNIYVSSQTPEGLEYAQSKEISVEYPSLKVVEEKYYIKSSEELEITTIGKCGNNELPSECVEESKDTIEANTWYEVNGNTIFTTNKNLSIEAIIGNNNEYGTKKTYEVVNIDNSEPNVSIESISTTSNKAVVISSCEDLESGISKYEFSKDGSTWLTSETNNYTFDIDQNINYKFKVRCTNGSGISKEVESESEVSANKIIKPTIEQISQTPENSEYAQSRTIRITYDGTGIEKPRYYYSYDKNTWTQITTATKDLTFTENKEIYAKTTDESENESEYAWYKITNIDTISPSISADINNDTVIFTLTDNIGVVAYGVNKTRNLTTPSIEDSEVILDSTSVSGNNVVVQFVASEAGTYIAWVKDVAGIVTYIQFIMDESAFIKYYPGEQWVFNYNGTEITDGSVQVFTVPITGKYKLEVWGAQGGRTSNWHGTKGYLGGAGGYTYVNVELKENQQIYIVVGANGESGGGTLSNTKSGVGGYNGGGTGRYGAGGGGATHIASTLIGTGELVNYSSNISDLIIVAGGGGGSAGAETEAVGGSGGGLTGLKSGSSCEEGSGGTQESGGAGGTSSDDDGNSCSSGGKGKFGIGGNGKVCTFTENSAGGGGGGLYGGGGGSNGSGGGGSGYINPDYVGETSSGINGCTYLNKVYTCSITGETDSAANGLAKVTLISID